MRIESVPMALITGRPGITPLSGAWRGRGAEPIEGVRKTDGSNRREGRSESADLVDTLEISAEAEAQLVAQLTPDQQRRVTELKSRDREVRSHEQAHLAAAGPYARGGPTYEYSIGPDGRQYAVGGEVQIDVSPVADDPEATIRKAQVVRAAASAPAEPSGQDRQVAAAAAQMEANARAELQQQRTEGDETGEAEAPTAADVDRDRSRGALFDVVV